MNPEIAYVEIDAGIRARGRITDLSAGGLAFEVSGTAMEVRAVEKVDNYFIELVIDNLKIVSGVQKAWSVIKTEGSSGILLSGVRFEIMSGEDRLKLYNVLEKIRSMPPAGPQVYY